MVLIVIKIAIKSIYASISTLRSQVLIDISIVFLSIGDLSLDLSPVSAQIRIGFTIAQGHVFVPLGGRFVLLDLLPPFGDHLHNLLRRQRCALLRLLNLLPLFLAEEDEGRKRLARCLLFVPEDLHLFFEVHLPVVVIFLV